MPPLPRPLAPAALSPAALGARSQLLVQGALTLAFAMLAPHSSSGLMTTVTVVLAVVAVGVGAAMTTEPLMRSVTLLYEVAAVLFGVVSLAADHYVPGAVVGAYLLVRLAQTSEAEFASGVPLPTAALPTAAPGLAPAAPVPSAAPAVVVPAPALPLDERLAASPFAELAEVAVPAQHLHGAAACVTVLPR